MFQVTFHRSLRIDGRQLLAHHSQIVIVFQRFFRLIGPDLLHMDIGIFNTAVFHDQFCRRLLPNPRNPRDIVGSIAHQRFQLDDLFRFHLVSFQNFFCMVIFNGRFFPNRFRHPDHDPV